MQFLDINGVKRIKRYTDDTFVTSEDVSEIEDASLDFYTKSEIDDKFDLKQNIIRQSNGEFLPILEHTYENYTCTAADVNNGYIYFMKVVPTSDNYYQPWYIRYTLDITTETDQCQGKYDMYLGSAGTTSHWIVFNRFYSTSYYPSYYHLMAWHNSAAKYADREANPIRIGERIYSAYGATTVARTYHIRVYETVGCTVTFPEEIEKYISFYSDANYGYNSTFNATTNGLIDQYDANTITYTQQTSNYLVNAHKNGSTDLRLPGYTLIGFNENGEALGISNYSNSYTSNTTSISPKGTRVYCTEGFDYTKGIRYLNTSTTFDAASANVNISTAINYSGVDLRYSDNCVASSTANSLGLVTRKPVYLRGTIGSDGLFYLAPIDVTYNSTTYQRTWVQDIPSIENEDGEYVYWFIGYPYHVSSYAASLFQLNLITQGELVWYKDGNLRPYIPDSSGGGSSTDTKNTTGATDTSDKIYLVGATTQAANPQTYSDNEVYTTSGVLTTKSVQVGGTAATMQYNSTDQSIEFIFA